ncbi:serine protease [Fusarium subglutinans]|uniref:Serine protease n=1 Tax=Gibberella subglutinans TaxID=42677 RepID=A0A8H5V5N5_GIBSU|nr:serine protease [Fusarium subglutinans]KAF5611927.1 serine protease [Fusarium subglutinans]
MAAIPSHPIPSHPCSSVQSVSLERPVVAEALARIAEESSRLMVPSASGEGSLRLLSLVGLKRLSFPSPANTPELDTLLQFLEETCLNTYPSDLSDFEPTPTIYPKLCSVARIQKGIANAELQFSIQQAIKCSFSVGVDDLINQACASRDGSLAGQVPPNAAQNQIHNDALDYRDGPVSDGLKRPSDEAETNKPDKRRRSSHDSQTLVPKHSLPSEKESQWEEDVLYSALNPQILCHAFRPQENHLRTFHLRLDDPKVPPHPDGTWMYEAIFSASMPESTKHGCTKGGSTKCYHEAEVNVISRAEMSRRMQSGKAVEEILEGTLCQSYISPSHGCRLCLLSSESEDAKPILYATAGTTKALGAHMLGGHSLVPNTRRQTCLAGNREAPRLLERDVSRMSAHDKVFLAYVVGRSVSQYYNTRLTAQQLWTLKSLSTIPDTEDPSRPATDTTNGLSLFSHRHPYVSINFKTEDELRQAYDSDLGMDFHQDHRGARFYPGPISLGLLLLDIWEDSGLTNDLTWSEAHVRRAQYAGYARLQFEGHQQIQQAIVNCLDVRLFAHNAEKTNARVIEKRDWLLRNVVHPLRLLYLSTFHSDTLALPTLQVGQISYPSQGYVSTSNKIDQYKSFMTFLEKPKGAKKDVADNGIEWISSFLDLSGAVHERVNTKGKQPKICILDTGCDPDCNFFKRERLGDPDDLKRIIWRDFATPKSTDMIDEDGVGARNLGSNGKHGTSITTLLLMLLPRANIYVARIAPHKRDMVDLETYDGVLDSIRRAIHHAATVWMVDIISMSFGYITEPTVLRVAIEDAIKDRRNGLLHPKLIMLAAASNDGGLSPELAPACWPEVISVRGTTSQGEFPKEYNPNESKSFPPHFGTLAQGVPCGYGFRWGTSFAAPIMAATAGLIQLYVSYLIAEEVKCGNLYKVNLYSRAYETEGMRQILAAFTAKSSDVTRAVQPPPLRSSLQDWEGTIWYALAQMKTPG